MISPAIVHIFSKFSIVALSIIEEKIRENTASFTLGHVIRMETSTIERIDSSGSLGSGVKSSRPSNQRGNPGADHCPVFFARLHSPSFGDTPDDIGRRFHTVLLTRGEEVEDAVSSLLDDSQQPSKHLIIVQRSFLKDVNC
jgi:hypothetical protein